MFIRMLKLTTVLFVMIAVFVIPTVVLSNGSDSSDPEIAFDMKCGFPKEISDDDDDNRVPVKDENGNLTTACGGYAATDCDGKSAEYEVIEAAGCTNKLERVYSSSYVLCITEKRAIPNGTVDCKLSDDETSCEDGDNYSITNRFYKSKCTATLYKKQPGM